MENIYNKDKEATKGRLMEAAGEIFRTKGYAALKATRIAYIAGVTATLIYRYFGNVEELFKAYLLRNDFWSPYERNLKKLLDDNRHDSGKQLTKDVLDNQLDYFYESSKMQDIIRWEITKKNEIASSVSKFREHMGDEILKITDNHFKPSGFNFRILLGLMIAGIYYLILHSKTNGGAFCGIDINKESDRKEMHRTLKQIIDWIYERAYEKNNNIGKIERPV